MDPTKTDQVSVTSHTTELRNKLMHVIHLNLGQLPVLIHRNFRKYHNCTTLKLYVLMMQKSNVGKVNNSCIKCWYDPCIQWGT